MDQFERNKVITSFKKNEVPILVATDVAGKIMDEIFSCGRANILSLNNVKLDEETATVLWANHSFLWTVMKIIF